MMMTTNMMMNNSSQNMQKTKMQKKNRREDSAIRLHCVQENQEPRHKDAPDATVQIPPHLKFANIKMRDFRLIRIK